MKTLLAPTSISEESVTSPKNEVLSYETQTIFVDDSGQAPRGKMTSSAAPAAPPPHPTGTQGYPNFRFVISSTEHELRWRPAPTIPLRPHERIAEDEYLTPLPHPVEAIYRNFMDDDEHPYVKVAGVSDEINDEVELGTYIDAAAIARTQTSHVDGF